jgi:hypothetical protein
LCLLEDTPRDVKLWVLLKLLPVVYWHKQYQKAQPNMREKYRLAWERTRDALQKAPPPAGMGEAERQHWQTWCEDKVNHFQRTSSAVEGRNGWLSQVYHNGRGFSEKRLIAQGVIHNYGIKLDVQVFCNFSSKG